MSDTPSSSDIQSLTDSINRLAGGNSVAKPTPAASSSGGGSGSDGGVIETFRRIASEGVPVYTAFKNIGQYGNYAQTGLAALASHLPVGSEAVGGFVKSLGEARAQNLANAQIGIGGNALFDLAAKAGKLGLSQEEYRQIIQQSGNALTSLGPSAQVSSERLLKLGSDLQTIPNEGRALVQSLQMQQSELSQAAVISQYGSKANLDDIETRKKATYFAGQLASEVYKQAQLTGKSTTAIEAELEERLKQPEIMAQMRLMSEDQRQTFIKTQASITGMGKDAADLGAVLARGGRLSDENQKQLMAMGPAAGEFQRAMRMSALAQTDDQKRQASDALDRAKAHVAAFQSSQQFANMMSNASPELAKYYRSQYEQNVLRERENAAMREYGGTRVQAQQQSEKDVALRTAGMKRDEVTGKVSPDEKQALARAYGEGELKAAAGANAMRQEVANLNTEFGKSPKAVQGFNKVMDMAFGPGGSVEQAQERIRSFSKDVINAFGGNITPAKGPAAGPGSTNTILQPPPKKHASGGDIDSGDIGIVGDGGPELVHGPSSVTSISETSNILKNAVKEAMPENPGIDINAISSKINTTISSVAPKADVPVKSAEQIKNEDLKAKAEEAIRIINESGEQQIQDQIRITKSGNLRMRTEFDEQGEWHASIGQASSEERIADLIKQADAIKAKKSLGEEKAKVEETQLAKEATITSSRQQNIEKAYAAMQDMDPSKMYADLGKASAEANAKIIEDKKSAIADEANISKPVKDAKPAIANDTTIAKPVEGKLEEPSFLTEVKTKFSDMFSGFKLPEFPDLSKISTPTKVEIPKPIVEVKAPMRSIVPPTPVVPKPVEKPKTVTEDQQKPKIEPVTVHKATLDDVTKLLEQLNKTMAQVASHSANISDASNKTAKNSARATGNKNYA